MGDKEGPATEAQMGNLIPMWSMAIERLSFFSHLLSIQVKFHNQKQKKKKKSLYESKKSSVFFLHYTVFLTSPFHPTLNSININKEHVNCKADFHHVPKSHLPSNTGPFANGSNLAQRTILKVTRII